MFEALAQLEKIMNDNLDILHKALLFSPSQAKEQTSNMMKILLMNWTDQFDNKVIPTTYLTLFKFILDGSPKVRKFAD